LCWSPLTATSGEQQGQQRITDYGHAFNKQFTGGQQHIPWLSHTTKHFELLISKMETEQSIEMVQPVHERLDQLGWLYYLEQS
jgi:hypothetical protein